MVLMEYDRFIRNRVSQAQELAAGGVFTWSVSVFSFATPG